MNINRIKGLLIQETYITIRSYEVILDILVFPVMSIVMFGFLAKYLSGSGRELVANSLLAGMLMWQVVFIVQYSVSVGSLWNIWSRNLSNLFIAPISTLEYLFSESFSGIIKAFLVFVPSAMFSIWFFNFNIFQIGHLNLFLYLINLIMFALSLGIVILGLIFRFGTRIQAFAWGLLPIIQPLSAAFYPVGVLPEPLRTMAYLLPSTYIFEAVRGSLVDPKIMQWQLMGVALVENILYFILALLFFKLMFRQSKTKGQFARLDG